MEYYSVLRYEILVHATTCIKTDNMLSEICETQKGRYLLYDSTYIRYLE